MAAQKSNRRNKSQNSMDFGRDFRASVSGMDSMANKEQRDNVPWTLLITLIAVLMTFFIVMPVLGYMYIDMYNVTNAAAIEVKKMRELRHQIIRENRGQ